MLMFFACSCQLNSTTAENSLKSFSINSALENDEHFVSNA